MELDILTITTTGTILFCGSFLQSTIGFGFGQLAAPLLLWLGYPLSDTVILIVLSGFIQTIVGSYRLRDHIPWKTVLWTSSLRYLALPVGVWLISVLQGFSQAVIKQTVGGLVLFVVILQGFLRPTPREKLSIWWDFLVFPLSGFLGGAAGIGGPPLVIWTMAHCWENKKIRAFMLASWLLGSPFIMILMLHRFGSSVITATVFSLLMTPITFLGAYTGIKYGNRLSRQLLKTVSYSILVAVSIISLLAPFF